MILSNLNIGKNRQLELLPLIKLLKARKDHNMNINLDNEIQESWQVPMSTQEVIMEDKNFNYNILAKTMLESNRKHGEDHRYIYKNKFKEEVKDYFLDGEFGMKKSTFEKHWKYIRKVDFDIITAENSKNGIVYKINHKDINDRKYVKVNSDILEKLIECTNLNVIKIYLILLYTCGTEYTQITQEWLCQKIGFSKGSRRRIKVITDFLKDDLKLIDINIVNGETVVINGKEVVKKTQYIKLL